MSRPILIVGDVQGDVERLREALAPYPENDVDTIFLGDFFQGGEPGAGGGAAAARLAMERANSQAVVGNHDIFLLVILERRRGDGDAHTWRARDGGPIEDIWLSRRGDWEDLRAISDDHELEAWVRGLPAMLKLEDGTLVQHTDDDAYAELGASMSEVNEKMHRLLAEPGGVRTALRYTIGRHAFDDEERLERYLQRYAATRIVHGHTPHQHETPRVAHGGRVLGYDGRFSRYWTQGGGEPSGPIGATVALLPQLVEP